MEKILTTEEYGMILPTNLYSLRFHALVENDYPEDGAIVLWFYKGIGEAPYVGSNCDEDFPGFDQFFAWCECPNPSINFVNKFNNE